MRRSSRPRYATLSLFIGLVAASAAAGLVANTSLAPKVLAGTIGISAAVWLVWRFGTGCAAGLLTLGALDALPGPNLETTQVANSITGQDVLVVALAGLLLYENVRMRDPTHGSRMHWLRLVLIWAAVFLAYYAFVVVRTWLTTPVPIEHAITFTRAFPYFAVLLVLLIAPLRRDRFRMTTLATLGTGAVIAAVAQAVAVAGHTPVSFLVHTYASATSSGLARLYTAASDIPFAGLPFGVGLVLFANTGRARLAGAVLATTSALAVAFGLTRAIYVGEVAGLTVAVVVSLLNLDVHAREARLQLARAGLIVAVGAGALVAYVPSVVNNSAVSGVSQRVNSLLADVSGTAYDRSVETRDEEITGIEAAIGPHWLFGLGALDPTFDYVSNAVGGNIQNPDVSLFGAVAIIGIVGVAIYAVPLFALLFGLLYQRWFASRRSRISWVSFGAIAWCTGVIVSSTTLGFVFVPAQVVGSAFVLALTATHLDSAVEDRNRA